MENGISSNDTEKVTDNKDGSINFSGINVQFKGTVTGDFHNYNQTGLYSYNTGNGAIANSIGNAPDGVLIVIAQSNGNVYHYLTSSYSERYFEIYMGGSWHDWRKQLFEDDLDNWLATKQDKLTYTPTDDNKVVHNTPTALASGTDLNTVTTQSGYFTAVGAKNRPDNADDWTIYLIMPMSGYLNGVQIAYTTNDGTTSMRSWHCNSKIVFTSWVKLADDSEVVHTANMRKPASDVVGLEDAPQALIKTALDSGVDLHTVTAPGIYPFNGCTFVNDMNSDKKWGFLIVTNVGNEVVLQQMIQGNNQVYGQRIYDGGNNIWSDWSIQNKTSIINRSSDSIVDIYTDKAIYSPGDNLKLSIEHTGAWSNVNISVYEYCNLIFSDSTITMPNSPTEYIWSVPDNNHVGYMIKVTITDFNGNNSSKFIGVNVCANPWEAPIYGFLGNYDSSLSTYKQKQIVKKLNRKHVNYVQFYDWYDRDDTPLRLLDTGMPETYWRDFMKRETYFSKVKKYIDICHDNGMMAMFYNLIYGSQLGNPSSTDPQLSWTNPNLTKEMFLYKDTSATTPYSENDMSFGGKINITYMNCLNDAWCNYLSGQSDVVYAFLPFDGWHVDQLGSLPSDTYGSDGAHLDWAYFGEGYGKLLRIAKSRHPDKQVTFNNCDNFGTDPVVNSNAVDFLYTEVWGGIGESFNQLASYIQANMTRYRKPLVLAAYVNKQKAESSDHGDGMINDTAAKLCDALIMSNGASHLEWGEHYLDNEYFPNNSLTLRDTTEQILTNYYDVYVAYLQMLNGTTWNYDTVTSNTHSLSKDFTINSIAYVEKNSNNGKILSLINMIGLAHNQWRDTNGTQVAPSVQTNIQISIATTDVVKSVWLIKADQSPEAVQIDFSQNSSSINFEIDKLEIFDMIILKNN